MMNALPKYQALSHLFATPMLASLLVLSTLVALLIGAYSLPVQQVVQVFGTELFGMESSLPQTLNYLVWDIRLPRVLLSIFVGGGLSIAGAAIQGLFRNPLADPALIGVTSGAMVFAVAGILFSTTVLGALGSWLGYATVTVMAFTGSLLTTLLVYWLSSSKGYTSVVTMLLAGVAVTALGGALTGLMTYFSSEDELRDITFWTLGSLGGANWKMLALIAPLVVLPSYILWRQSSQLDLLLLGEREAAYTGVNTQRTKWMVIGCAALIVGACVAVSGVIAFVALVVPHLVRLIQGPKHRSLLLASALLGGLLLIWADTAARTFIAPAELPIGILTALLGAPFFIWLLLQTKRSYD
jgi:iron complex transport system permease protein